MTTLTTKSIKDYLPFYMGCEVMTKRGDGKLISVGIDGNPTVVQIKNDDEESGFYGEYEDFEFEEKHLKHIKPILRNLSDMTEEEHKEMDLMERGSEPGLPIYYIGSEKVYSHTWWISSERIRYLLSKSFDLFNLIPEGLAIDKQTLKPRPANPPTPEGYNPIA